MRYLAILLLLAGCAHREAPAPPSAKEAVKTAIAQKVKEAPPAPKTSIEAKSQLADLRAQLDAARAEVAELTGKVNAAEQTTIRLQRQEVADHIVLYSWILIALGGISGLVGVFLLFRFGGATATTVTACGAGVVGLGLIGLLLAPHWIFVAWIFGVCALLGCAVLIVQLLHLHLPPKVQKVLHA